MANAKFSTGTAPAIMPPMEIAATGDLPEPSAEPLRAVERCARRTVRPSDVAEFPWRFPTQKSLKALCFVSDGELCIVFLRGDRRLNEIRLQNHLGCIDLRMAEDGEMRAKG